MRILAPFLLALFLPVFLCSISCAETAQVEKPQSFKKAHQDAIRMLNWWKYKLKKDPDFQGLSVSRAPALQYAIEEESLPPKKK